MNIFFIGSNYINSSSVRLMEELNKLGHHAGFTESFSLVGAVARETGIPLMDYYQQKIPIKLSNLWKLLPEKKNDIEIRKDIDVLFVEQNGFTFINDEEHPVIYYHRDTPSEMFMKDMDCLLYRFKIMETVLDQQYPKIWNNGISKFQYFNGVNMDEFEHSEPKFYKGINWIGTAKGWHHYFTYANQAEYYKYPRIIEEWARDEDLIRNHGHGHDYPTAKKLMQRSEAVLILPGKKSYVTRKIYEAAASNVLIVLWVQDDMGLEVYNKLGLIDGYNCIMFKTKEELREISENFDKYNNKDKIIKRAFKWVKHNHTWKHRAQELLNICKNIQKKEVKKWQELRNR